MCENAAMDVFEFKPRMLNLESDPLFRIWTPRDHVRPAVFFVGQYAS